MRLKPGVRLAQIVSQIVLGAQIVESVYQRHGYELRITSCNDGTEHKSGSLHYAGKAFDCGTKELDPAKIRPADLTIEIRQALGPEFDVVLENEDDRGPSGNEHIHVEWDPKA